MDGTGGIGPQARERSAAADRAVQEAVGRRRTRSYSSFDLQELHGFMRDAGSDPGVSTVELVDQLRSLGVEEGGVLLVHTSFRAVGPVQDGPEGLIAALQEALGEGGTLVMPAWASSEALFDPVRSEVSKSLGIVAQTFWRLPGALRNDHVHAFAARGPRAEEILRDPLPVPPHAPASPVGRVHELDGQVLLLGVNHDADTTILFLACRARTTARRPSVHAVVLLAST